MVLEVYVMYYFNGGGLNSGEGSSRGLYSDRISGSGPQSLESEESELYEESGKVGSALFTNVPCFLKSLKSCL